MNKIAKGTICALALSFIGLWSHAAVAQAKWCGKNQYHVEVYNGATGVTAEVRCGGEVTTEDLPAGQIRRCCRYAWVTAPEIDDSGGRISGRCSGLTPKTRVDIKGSFFKTRVEVSCQSL